ncbi:MAG: HTH domain-containing protein [Streptomycetaceae bacterium]|nr:HTH domain-containing protein [Streptomycetaceae bacterium]
MARNLRVSCYSNHKRRGTLDRFPRLTGNAEPWTPTGRHGRRMLQRYQRLTALRPPLSTKRLAFELGVSERQVWRYAAALRARQADAA